MKRFVSIILIISFVLCSFYDVLFASSDYEKPNDYTIQLSPYQQILEKLEAEYGIAVGYIPKGSEADVYKKLSRMTTDEFEKHVRNQYQVFLAEGFSPKIITDVEKSIIDDTLLNTDTSYSDSNDSGKRALYIYQYDDSNTSPSVYVELYIYVKLANGNPWMTYDSMLSMGAVGDGAPCFVATNTAHSFYNNNQYCKGTYSGYVVDQYGIAYALYVTYYGYFSTVGLI